MTAPNRRHPGAEAFLTDVYRGRQYAALAREIRRISHVFAYPELCDAQTHVLRISLTATSTPALQVRSDPADPTEPAGPWLLRYWTPGLGSRGPVQPPATCEPTTLEPTADAPSIAADAEIFTVPAREIVTEFTRLVGPARYRRSLHESLGKILTRRSNGRLSCTLTTAHGHDVLTVTHLGHPAAGPWTLRADPCPDGPAWTFAHFPSGDLLARTPIVGPAAEAFLAALAHP